MSRVITPVSPLRSVRANNSTSKRISVFIFLAIGLWFIQIAAWDRFYFPFNWYAFILFGCSIFFILMLTGFGKFGLLVFTIINFGLILGLIPLFGEEKIKFYGYFLRILLDMVGVTWIALAIVAVMTSRLNKAIKILISSPLTVLLILKLSFQHPI